MTPFDLAVIMAGACGLIMVTGGIFLLYKGAISLSKTSGQEAASLEFKKMFKLTTHYPALGLFIIGVAFMALALSFSKPKSDDELTIKGQVKGEFDPGSLLVFVTVDKEAISRVDTDGRVRVSITPSVDALYLRISCPGYKETIKKVEIKDSRFGVISIGEIVLANKVVEKPPVNPANLEGKI